ncbi:S-adenosylmethionine decarboxylase proenzyme, partial [Streptococcus pneumoniae]|nr:S-adenosylmethionine decarboxylase proenzyme [Streptococcus pneumoniae]
EGLNAKTRESIELPRGTGSFEIKQRETKAL